MKLVQCNRCPRQASSWNSSMFTEITIHDYTYDLCAGCTQELERWIAQRLDHVEVVELPKEEGNAIDR
jgi:hypothetical protein